MKKSLKIIRIIAFALLVALVVVVTYNVLAWKDTNGNYVSTTKQLYATGDNLMDVVFVGSSHCYCGIYPSELWNEHGVASFDMATSGQDRNSSYYYVRELLKTQKPKVVVVDIYSLSFERPDDIGNDYRNYLSMKPSLNSIQMVLNYSLSKEEKSDFLARFPIIHTRYRELDTFDFDYFIPNEFQRGEAYGNVVSSRSLNREVLNSTETGELPETTKEWIDKFMKLAEDEGFDLKFVLIPYEANLHDQIAYNTVGEYVISKGGSYTDFNKLIDEIGINEATDFIDSGHLNANGAIKLTDYIYNSMLSPYNLADHRGDDKYYQWDLNSEYMRHQKAEKLLVDYQDRMFDVTTLASLNQVYTIINLDGDFTDANENYFEMLQVFGMDYDSFVQGGTWIYYEGTLTKVCNMEVGSEEYFMNLGRNDILRVGYYDLYEPSNLMLNKNCCLNGMGHLNIVAYDEMTEKIMFGKIY